MSNGSKKIRARRTRQEREAFILECDQIINEEARLRLQRQRNTSFDSIWLTFEGFSWTSVGEAKRKFGSKSPMRIYELAVLLEATMLNRYPRKLAKAEQHLRKLIGTVGLCYPVISSRRVPETCIDVWLTFDVDDEGNAVGHRFWRDWRGGAIKLPVNLLPPGTSALEIEWLPAGVPTTIVCDNADEFGLSRSKEVIELDLAELDVFLVDYTRKRVINPKHLADANRSGNR